MTFPLAYRLYWHLPNFARTWAASYESRRLDRERYGTLYHNARHDIARRDTWSPGQFADFQKQCLVSLVRHAYSNVPYYRALRNTVNPDAQPFRSGEDLACLPILEKHTVRQHSSLLLDERLNRRKLTAVHTSGTTGTPLTLYRDRQASSALMAYVDARVYAPLGIQSRVTRNVHVGPRLVAAPQRRTPPWWIEVPRWNSMYMSMFHLSPRYLPHYVKAIRDYGPDFIQGIPSAIAAIARWIVASELAPIPMRVCLTWGEQCLTEHRDAIRQAFLCRTVDSYGCAEMVLYGVECEYGAMHLSPEVGIVELVDDNDRPVACGCVGQTICTGLLNYAQPLVRYRLGDLAMYNVDECPCGSRFPALTVVRGRASGGAIVGQDGRQVRQVGTVFREIRSIVEAQVVQEDGGRCRVRVVAGAGFGEADSQRIQRRLLALMGGGAVTVELTDHIARGPGGKFRAVIVDGEQTRTGPRAT